MAEVVIRSIGRAVPETAWNQRDLVRFNPWLDQVGRIDRLFGESPVETRSLFVPPDWYHVPRGLTETNQAWRDGALALGRASVVEALAEAGLGAADIDWFGATSVTGYTTPGLDLLLAKDLGMRPNISRAHFNCVGCHAAVPLLKVAHDHVAARGGVAASLAVEICSACFSLDPDPQNLIAVSLFADGAATVILADQGPGPRIVGFGSLFDFDHIEALGFNLTEAGFRIVLDPKIPVRVGIGAEAAVGSLLEAHGVARHQVSRWALHPGGSRILDEVALRLGLSDVEMGPSRQVLRRYGNMSSPSVMFSLVEALSEPPPPGTFGVVAAFGPGLGVEAALLAF